MGTIIAFMAWLAVAKDYDLGKVLPNIIQSFVAATVVKQADCTNHDGGLPTFIAINNNHGLGRFRKRLWSDDQSGFEFSDVICVTATYALISP